MVITQKFLRFRSSVTVSWVRRCSRNVDFVRYAAANMQFSYKLFSLHAFVFLTYAEFHCQRNFIFCSHLFNMLAL